VSDHILDAYIDGLSDDLEPVRRLWSPWVRAAAWLAVVAGAAAVLARFSDLHDLAYRLRYVPDMWLAVLGSTLTMALGAVATFQLSLPDRSTRWALLPLPGLALWVAGTGMGCLRTWVIPETHSASLQEAHSCFVFIIGLSVPLSLLTVLMVRRAFPYRPNLVAGVGGLTISAAAATLLNFFHPYDAGATDFAVHLVAISLVIAVNRVVGGRLLASKSAALPQGSAT
jgi:hypothetical protein